MRIPHLLQNADIIQLDIQELIHGFQCSLHREIVLELDDDGLLHQSFEETVVVRCVVGGEKGDGKGA